MNGVEITYVDAPTIVPNASPKSVAPGIYAKDSGFGVLQRAPLVLNILLPGDEPQMGWIHTVTNEATVIEFLIVWNLAHEQGLNETVCFPGSFSIPNDPVAVIIHFASPEPACAGLMNPGPKARVKGNRVAREWCNFKPSELLFPVTCAVALGVVLAIATHLFAPKRGLDEKFGRAVLAPALIVHIAPATEVVFGAVATVD